MASLKIEKSICRIEPDRPLYQCPNIGYFPLKLNTSSISAYSFSIFSERWNQFTGTA
jgi:hypothetical protein